MLVKYFSNAPFPLALHVHAQLCHHHQGIFFTPSMLSNLITQSPKLYELIRIMDNETKYETKKPKSSHENVDYFPMFIPSI